MKFEEFKKDYEAWKKEDVLWGWYQMLEMFNKFESFIQLKYGKDFLDGWLYYLRTDKIKDEEE